MKVLESIPGSGDNRKQLTISFQYLSLRLYFLNTSAAQACGEICHVKLLFITGCTCNCTIAIGLCFFFNSKSKCQVDQVCSVQVTTFIHFPLFLMHQLHSFGQRLRSTRWANAAFREMPDFQQESVQGWSGNYFHSRTNHNRSL